MERAAHRHQRVEQGDVVQLPVYVQRDALRHAAHVDRRNRLPLLTCAGILAGSKSPTRQSALATVRGARTRLPGGLFFGPPGGLKPCQNTWGINGVMRK